MKERAVVESLRSGAPGAPARSRATRDRGIGLHRRRAGTARALPRADRDCAGVDPGGGARAEFSARRARSRGWRRSLAARLRAARRDRARGGCRRPRCAWLAHRPKCPDRSCYNRRAPTRSRGAGSADHARLLPRLPPRRARRRRPLPRLRLAAAPAPSRARRARDRACRLRRLLRHHREARRSFARRQAGDRRRPQARRRAHRLLRRAHLRRALGDADVRGAAAVPARQRGAAGHGEIRARRPRGARPDARAHAAGRAGVDRRGVHRSVRHRAAARHDRRPRRSPALPREVEREPRHHRLDRALLQQVPRQDRLRPRQAARLCGARPRARRPPSWRRSRSR